MLPFWKRRRKNNRQVNRNWALDPLPQAPGKRAQCVGFRIRSTPELSSLRSITRPRLRRLQGAKRRRTTRKSGAEMGKKKFKKNGPICFRCGGMKHRRRKDGSRFCTRFGFLPSGKFLGTNGIPRTQEQTLAAIERVSEIRLQIENMK